MIGPPDSDTVGPEAGVVVGNTSLCRVSGSPIFGGKDPEAATGSDGGGSRAGPELDADRGDVMVDGLGRQVESLGNLTIGQTFGEQTEHLGLTGGQARGTLSGGASRAARHVRHPHLGQTSADHRCARDRSQTVEDGQRPEQ